MECFHNKFTQLVNKHVPTKYCFPISFPSLLGLPKKFCVQLNLSIKYGLNTKQPGKVLITNDMLHSVILSQHLSGILQLNMLASKIHNNPKQFWAYINQTANLYWCYCVGDKRCYIHTTTKNNSKTATILTECIR